MVEERGGSNRFFRIFSPGLWRKQSAQGLQEGKPSGVSLVSVDTVTALYGGHHLGCPHTTLTAQMPLTSSG